MVADFDCRSVLVCPAQVRLLSRGSRFDLGYYCAMGKEDGMERVELLLAGVPGRSSEGYLGQSTVTLVDGTTLIDTGGPSRRPLLENTLAAAGIDPDDISDVLLTHLHFDHCDNLDLFPEATVHAYAPELDRVLAGDTDWATSVAAPHLLADRDVSRFVAGDTVAGFDVLETPGHCEHHVSFVAEREGLTVGVVGDAFKNLHEFETRDPTAIYDADTARESIDRLTERVEFAIPGHDTPFYVTDDGESVPCGDVELDVGLSFGGETGTVVGIRSNRMETREYPSFVHDLTRPAEVT